MIAFTAILKFALPFTMGVVIRDYFAFQKEWKQLEKEERELQG